MFVVNQEFQDSEVTLPNGGASRGDVQIFYANDGSLAGKFGAVETQLGTTTQLLEPGVISFFSEEQGEEDEIQGSITFASISSSGGTKFPITGGVDSLACAQGVLKAAGFENGNVLLDMVLCGKSLVPLRSSPSPCCWL